MVCTMFPRRSSAITTTLAVRRPVLRAFLVGSIVLFVSACADRDSLVYRVREAGVQTAQNTPNPDSTAETETAQNQVSQAQPPTGPVRLGQPLEAPSAGPQNQHPASEEPEDRFAFLDWFGDAANAARVKNPAAELRKARAITAGMEEQSEPNAPATTSRPLIVTENSRLMPTYADGLPRPGGEPPDAAENSPLLRGANVTGSVTLPEEPVEKPTVRDAKDPVKEQLLKMNERLRQAKQKRKAPQVRHANADPDTVTSVRPVQIPDRHNPIRIQLSTNHDGFDQGELEILKNVAELHWKTGRAIHIHGVSRGHAGTSDTRIERIQRLRRHTERAIGALARIGVDPDDITTSAAEQRMTGGSSRSARVADRDRLEFSLQ